MKEVKSILIVEDERTIAEALEFHLTYSGFAVRLAFDGREALDILKAEKFDLILLDLIMPQINGFGVLTELKKRNDATPVIILSNLGQEEYISKARVLGVKDYFVKATTPLAVIADYIKQYRG